MAEGFKIICTKCGEEASISGYMYEGTISPSLISYDYSIDEDEPDAVEMTIQCSNCGNYVYLQK